MSRMRPSSIIFRASAGPVLPGASAMIAFAPEIARMTSSLATTKPVRNPGKPSFERLKQRIVFSSQSVVTSGNTIFGKGAP